MIVVLLVFFVGLVLSTSDVPRYAKSGIPVAATLTALWTPFESTFPYKLKLSVLPAYTDVILDKMCPGAECVALVCGSMGQWNAMSMQERMELAEAWVPLLRKRNPRPYIVVQVGDLVQENSVQLARHAAYIGADAILSVPPTYQLPNSPQSLVEWFAPVAAAAVAKGQTKPIPFFYYHIPGTTHVTFSMKQLIPALLQIPNFSGVKYVESGDASDYMHAVGSYGVDPSDENRSIALLYAPEPKIRSFTLGATGFILAESFYRGTLTRMACAFANSANLKEGVWNAQKEQNWKSTVDAVFGATGQSSNAKRAVFKYYGVDIGIDRPPNSEPITQAQYEQMITSLTGLGFFNQSIPQASSCLLPGPPGFSLFPSMKKR